MKKKKKRRVKPKPAEIPVALPLLLLYAISGFCTLTLEMVWTREIALRAGNTVIAATLVIMAFFVATALGNLLGARLVRRAIDPLLFYGWFETAAGLAAILTFTTGRWLWSHGDVLISLSGEIPATLLLVGLPCFLSGVAFPSLAERFIASPETRTMGGGPFYGINLVAAAIGVIAGGVLLPWWFGVKEAFGIAAVLQIAGGLLAWRIAARSGKFEKTELTPTEITKIMAVPVSLGWTLYALSGILSLAAQGLLIMWARQILQGSVYAICSVLSVFIAGLGLGALISAYLRSKGKSPVHLLAFFATLSGLLLFIVPSCGAWLVGQQVMFNYSSPPGMLGEALGWSVLWLLSLTLCLGTIFPLAWELTNGDSLHQGSAMGKVLALNKLGAAAGAVAATFLLIPHLGLNLGTCAIGWGYLLMAIMVLAWTSSRQWRAILAGLMIAAIGTSLWQSLHPMPALGSREGEKTLASYWGPYGPVDVVEKEKSGSLHILLNSQQRLSGTQQALSSQLHESWVPLLFTRQPDRVLTIGMAAGISASAALDLSIKELDAVELVPEVVRAAHDHFAPWNHALFSDPRAHVIIGDGRLELDRLPGKFDAIICDLLFPQEDGTANLYSRDFLQRAYDHLNSGGTFTLWLPCYQNDPETAGVIIRTFLDVFPNAIAIRSNLDPLQPTIGLLGSNLPIPISREFVQTQLASPAFHALADKSPYFTSPENAWLLLAGDLHAANPGFADYPATTDNNPLFTYIGPRKLEGRLIGVPFLNWIGRRFLQPTYPSCDLGQTPPADILGSIRAANFYFAAAVAESVVPGDNRSDNVRTGEVFGYMAHAKQLAPQTTLSEDDLGR